MADYNSDRTGSNIDFTLDKVDALVDSGNNVTADGLTVDGNAKIISNGTPTLDASITGLQISRNSYPQVILDAQGELAGEKLLGIANDERGMLFRRFDDAFTTSAYLAKIGSNGDVSFYEDTGTTAKMVWDASAESLGIGTTAPFTTLALPFGAGIGIGDASINTIVSRSSVFPRVTTIADSYNNASSRIDFTMRAGATEENTPLSILASGNVGIGTASPSAKLDVVGDINVSGGVYLGGTGAANKLDDYEEGDWTPAISSNTPPSTVTHSIQDGYYVKVGKLVTVSFDVQLSSWSGGSNFVFIDDLPFVTNDAVGMGSLSMENVSITSTSYGVSPRSSVQNHLIIRYDRDNNTSATLLAGNLSGNERFRGSFSYTTDS